MSANTSVLVLKRALSIQSSSSHNANTANALKWLEVVERIHTDKTARLTVNDCSVCGSDSETCALLEGRAVGRQNCAALRMSPSRKSNFDVVNYPAVALVRTHNRSNALHRPQLNRITAGRLCMRDVACC